MNIGAPLAADLEEAKALEPRQRALRHPLVLSKSLDRVDTTAGDAQNDTQMAPHCSAAGVAVSHVEVQHGGAALSSTPATHLADQRDGIERHIQQRQSVEVRVLHCTERHCEGNAALVDFKMALRPRAAAIRQIRRGCTAPFLAGTLTPPSAVRDQPSLPASATPCSRCGWCKRLQTLACYHLCSRSHQGMSCGNNSLAVPLLSVNRIPVNAARPLMRSLAPFGLALALGSDRVTNS